MSFPRYPKYKDSGVEWLEEVPEHWRVSRLGSIFRQADEDGDDGLEILSVSIHDGVSDKELNEKEMDRKVTRSDDRSKYKKVQPGDLVYNMMRAWQGGFGAVAVPGMVSPAYVVARPISDFSTPFVEQLLRTPQAIEQMRRYSQGVTDFRLRLYWEEFKGINVVLPPRAEQTTIASFLDRETSKIDALVAEQRRLIELLKEKRQAVISHAVTKGLNPNAPMKPSGIEWLGDVPEHWDALSYRHLVTRLVVGIAEAATHAYAEEGVPIVRSTNIKSGEIDQSDMLFIKSEFAKTLATKALHSGDIVTTRTGANVGASAVVPSSLHMSQCFTLLISSPKLGCNSQFYNHFINSIPGRCYVDLSAWGSSQPNISVPILQEMPTVFPPPDEQNEIVRHIEQSSGRYGALIAEAERGIDLLQERRTALISAAVTGKIDVRGLAQTEAR